LQLADEKLVSKFTKNFNENIKGLMELMNVSWLDIQLMPYPFFTELLRWKVDLEDKKRKKMEEQSRIQAERYKKAMEKRSKIRK